MMKSSKISEKNSKWNSKMKANRVMEQIPSKKTELKSVKGADIKLQILMKKIVLIIALFTITASAFAQLKINNVGMVEIKAQTIDWASALRTNVPTKSSCAYNLWSQYLNKDVFFVCAEGYAWSLKALSVGSDISLKKNITPIENALQKIKNLKGVRYQYKDGKEAEENNEESNEGFSFGFIAQEVEKIFPEVVKDMPDGTKAITYTELIAVLVEAIKEQQLQIENLRTMIDGCCQRGSDYSLPKNQDESNRPEEIQDENSVKKTSVEENNMQDVENGAKLFQNAPNPFSENTEIRFEIPEHSISANLLIHNMQGTEIKSYTITAKGAGNMVIQAKELQAGMYMYTLLVNNMIVDTKKMILTK